MRRVLRISLALAAVVALPGTINEPMGRGQAVNLNGVTKPSSFVRFVAEPQTVVANRESNLELRFAVVEPYHINSHRPRSEYLIATTLTVQPVSGVEIGDAAFPEGHLYSFPFDPAEKVDVYSGGFIVRLRVRAVPGEHAINATLRYQACDNASCYPPKTMPIQVLFTAR
jgi:hypothetical protein